MSLLIPAGLALGLTLPIVIIFYLLKVRRHDEEVSSTFLWNDLIRDLAAHEPLQRLRWNVLLALQLLLLTLLTFALARPFYEQQGERPVHAVLVLDASASMQASDGSGSSRASRFQQATAAARQTLAGLPESSLATVILAAAHPQVLVAATPDRRQADRAIMEAARPTGAAGDMREALLLARSLGGDPSARRIHVFTDGAFRLSLDLPEDLGAVSVSQVGEPLTGNVGITAIASRPDPRDNRRRQLFTRVENFAATPIQARLTVEVDGQVVDERTLDLTANSASEQVVEDLPAGARAASVALAAVGSAAANGLLLDDTAHAVLSQRRSAQVLLVSNGNQFLRKVLSLLPGLELYEFPARRYLAVEADKFDVVVFDDYLPPLLPRGNLLVVNPPERGPVRTSGDVRRPRVGSWERDDPLLAYVDVRDLAVNRARKLDLPRWARPLVSTPEGYALLAAGQDGDRRMAIVPFDLRQSNLPLSPAFPILMSNLIAYLAPSGVVQAPEIRTGEPETLAPLPQAERVRITLPDQRVSEIRAGSGPLTFAATDAPGLYRVQQIVPSGSQTIEDDLFAANLADRAESDIRSRVEGLASAAPEEGGLTMLTREVWPALAALALALLMVEWFWFHRRV